jgi:hypothetical protein
MLRTLARFLINLVCLAAALLTVGWVSTLPAYQHASHDHRIAMLAGVAVAWFVVAVVGLAVVKPASKASKGKKGKKSKASAGAYGYFAPAKRK